MHSRWRRFLPKRRLAPLPTAADLKDVQTVSHASTKIEQLKSQLTSAGDDAAHLRKLLLVQTPRAVLAQQEMDKHKRGYHNREKRLYELIDFNDTYVSLVLALTHEELPGFAEKLEKDMADFCAKLHTPAFTQEQFDAITRGLSREIAVFRAAIKEGFDAKMTSRTEDAFGIDMVITDPLTGMQLNIDCKTPPAFRHRLEELLHDGRITEADLVHTDETDFITIINRRNEERIPVTLLCVRQETLSEITNFTFADTKPLATLLRQIFSTIDR